MYHALYDGAQEFDRIAPPDRPYALSVDQFTLQMDWLVGSGIPVVSLAQASAGGDCLPQHAVLLTFDDGHDSGYRHALPLLRDRGLSATFFVTTDFVAGRLGFCSWTQLAEMSRYGMAIQSHGRTHRFFDDLSDAEAREELVSAKTAIERGTGGHVHAISFPGGRYRIRDIGLGTGAGYRLFFTSAVGVNSPEAFTRATPIRRIAVKRTTTLASFTRYARAAPSALIGAAAIAGAKRIVRHIAGNRLYQRLYERLSS
jgi:peptidoglycan/xylan/chitin deacetylase (PgdA/CDA1 family)